jgi:hypothetical protein
MDRDEREYVAAVVNYFWPGLGKPHTVNEKAAEVIYEGLREVQSCSASMDLVPGATYGRPGISYIVKEIAMIGKRILSGDTAAYNSCRDKFALNYKYEIHAALNGL